MSGRSRSGMADVGHLGCPPTRRTSCRSFCRTPPYDDLVSEQSASSAGTEQAEYVVVLRARPSARFLPEESCELVLNAPTLDLRGVRVRTFTRRVNDGGKGMPRALTIEVRGYAGLVDGAVGQAAAIARPIATVAGFVANVQVVPRPVRTESSSGRLSPTSGVVGGAHHPASCHGSRACTAFVTLATDSPRVSRMYLVSTSESAIGVS